MDAKKRQDYACVLFLGLEKEQARTAETNRNKKGKTQILDRVSLGEGRGAKTTPGREKYKEKKRPHSTWSGSPTR